MTASSRLDIATPFQDPSHTPPVGKDVLREARRSAELSPCSGSDRQSAIHQTVIRLLDQTATAEERRWSPRLEYVRPGWVHFKQPHVLQPGGNGRLLVVTTDISFEGVGLLCWQEIPFRHVLLEVCNVCFACNVRWHKNLDHQIHRYGLHFYDVLNAPGDGRSNNSCPAF